MQILHFNETGIHMNTIEKFCTCKETIKDIQLHDTHYYNLTKYLNPFYKVKTIRCNEPPPTFFLKNNNNKSKFYYYYYYYYDDDDIDNALTVGLKIRFRPAHTTRPHYVRVYFGLTIL